MSVVELDEMLSRMDTDACVSFFQRASETDRKAASARVLRWNEVFDAYQHVNSWQVKNQIAFGQKPTKRTEKAILLTKDLDLGRIDLPKQVKRPEAANVINLAILATCGFTEAKKIQFTDLDAPLKILRARNPKWFGSWLEMVCGQHPVGTWNTIQAIEQTGLCNVERGDNYLFSMALTLGQLEAQTLLTLLESEPALQNLMWKMLESEPAVVSLHDPFSLTSRKPSIIFDPRKWTTYLEEWQRASYIWKTTLTEAACSQRIDRDRILNISFDWIAKLTGDGESVSAGGSFGTTSPVEWWQSIHDEIALVEQRKQNYTSRYIGLLSAKDNRTLTWAINHISGCSLLPLDDLFSAIPPVLLGKRKDPAIAALKLLEEIAHRGEEESERASIVALDGLDHSSSDIQKRVITLLKKLKTSNNPAVARGLQDKMGALSGLTKQEALKLIPAELQFAQEVVPQSNAIQEIDENTFIARIADVPDDLASSAGLTEALAAVLEGAPLPAVLKLTSANIPRLDPEKIIHPIDNVDDLLYLAIRVLEGHASGEDFDKALDGISRLCASQSLDFGVRVSALTKKVEALLPDASQAFGVDTPIIDVAGVCKAWITGKGPSDGLFKQLSEVIANSAMFVAKQDTHHGPMHFFSLRAHEIAKRAAARQALPLLAAPSHQGGWVDPITLTERIAVWINSKTKFDKADFIQCLLRLAPEHRAEALKVLPQNDEEYFRALRWALGDDLLGQMTTPEIWVAAFRCRDPRGESPLLQSKFPDLGAGSATNGGIKECLNEYAKRDKSIFGTAMDAVDHDLPLEFDPPSKRRHALKFFPTELLRDPKVRWLMSDVSELLWLHDRESFFYLQSRRMALYLESDGNYWKSSWDCLFDPDVSADGAGVWLIALGLSAKGGDTSRTALDALIAAVDDNRISGSSFGKVMAKLLPTGKMTLTRWARAIKETARISPLHARFVLDALTECFVRLPKDSWKNAPISLLEIAYETGTTHGVQLAHWHLSTILEGIEGKGKAAKLAKLIRTMPDTNAASFKKSVAIQILESRVQRAQRWQRWEEASRTAAVTAKN